MPEQDRFPPTFQQDPCSPASKNGNPTDTANSLDSLSRALKVGFGLMKWIMIILAIIFVLSNIYWVPEGFVAVQARFGRIIGKDAGAIHPPGGPYLALPFPLDRIIRIPTTIQKTVVYKAFWSETEDSVPTIDSRPQSKALRPGVHGSLVTADKNIVQGVWVIHYKLDDDDDRLTAGPTAACFVNHVGSMGRARAIIRRLAQAAIVSVVSQTQVADFVAGRIDNRAIGRRIATRLSQLQTGLTVTSVTASQYAVPKVLAPDFEAVTQAESQKALAIEKASRQRVSALNELAGSGWQYLLDTIDDYERLLHTADSAAEPAAFEAVEAMLLAGQIGGNVRQCLDEARSEKTTTIQRARASASRFAELLPAYEKNPAVVKSQLVQDTVGKIFSEVGVQSLYLPEGQKLFLDLGQQDWTVR